MASNDKLKRSMDAAREIATDTRPAPAIPPARRRVEEVRDAFPEAVPVALTLGFLGTGQGGARIAQAFWDKGYRRVAAFNLTKTDFEGLADEMPKVSLDIGGAGKDMRLAADALRGASEDVHDLMVRGWGNSLDVALVCAGMGGGTGGGTASGLVGLARRYMEEKGLRPRVGAIVSLPAPDSQQVSRNAVQAFRDLVECKASPIVIIDNGRINELYDRPPMADLFPTANRAVADLLHTFNVRAAERSPYISFDRSELLQLLDDGIVVMGAMSLPVGDIDNPAAVSEAMRAGLSRSVLAAVDLAKGRKAACVFAGSKDVLGAFSSDYFEAGFNQLDRVVGSGRKTGDGDDPVVVHRGLYPRDGDGLDCYTMVSGLEPPHARLADLARKGGLSTRADPGLAHYLGVQD
jgi:cell division GTPase FtsZ